MRSKIYELTEAEYHCEMIEIQIAVDGRGRHVITYLLKVIGSMYDGFVIEKKCYVVNHTVAEFLKTELTMLGIPAENAKELETIKSQSYGKQMRIAALVNEQGVMVYHLKGVMDENEPQVTEDHEYVGENWDFESTMFSAQDVDNDTELWLSYL